MKQYEITVTWDGGVILQCDSFFLETNDLLIGQSVKQLISDKAIASLIKYGFKSVVIKQGYFIDIVVG